ncbi:MAG: SAM-dependent chlorinase/fluorinase [Candidatus Melainabacteria bacterium]|nr:SAM-dependent chlorinase/fluorinase [Candidatus Melainabacteria bacterium]MBI3308695.1 SAM-dependent chlorinase/fluorinase [Candidatus Melainabacteria bacterium]
MSFITLTTDFGSRDPFAGILKGVIYSINPNAKITDITNDVSPQNIQQANFILKTSYRFFPKNSIHLCVVDPGVGSARKPLLIETSDYFFIGPNNGIFSTIIETENIKQVIELTEKKYWLPEVSQTFHGRDIFAPIAAFLSQGKNPKHFGNQINVNELITLPKLEMRQNKNTIAAQVQFIDHFGNIITNIPNDILFDSIKGTINNHNFDGLVQSFSGSNDKNLSAIKGSSGYMEIFIRNGNAAHTINAKFGDKLTVSFV